MSRRADGAGSARGKGVSLGETIYQTLRDDIIHGALRPGARLHLSDRAKAEGVSLSIVREAAARLASEGLLDAVPQRGFSVPELSVEDLVDLSWTRVYIETLVVREAVVHGDIAWESELVAVHHRLNATPMFDGHGGHNPEWMKLHGGFHEALAAGCPHRRIRHLRRQLFDASEIYRSWSGPGEQMSSITAQEHTSILEAALARDADAAVARATQHIEGMTRHLEDTAKRLEERGAFVTD
ncbi:GntR family transcriptional regulator [Mycolicibacterium stellerae]|uniref:GntR family transcriptional regulator n=1 Tax=Mycolicibacterium stellerae TaxID=2358193 RepID=UPI0013DDBFA3|nr:GntR family transcriptional regulator [Mycolicibacterium stellerae]